jgi:hypothetical protein
MSGNIDDAVWQELIVKANLFVDGVDITPEAIEFFNRENRFQEEIHYLFEYDFVIHVGTTLPCGIFTPHGLFIQFKWNPDSVYVLDVDSGGITGIYKKTGESVLPVTFVPRPGYYGKQTADGQPMGKVAVSMPGGGCVLAVYSNECVLKDKYEDCLFCNINATKDTYSEAEGTFWKTPRQIGEAMAAAYHEGTAHHFHLTGGLITERREVEYYIDVADEIKIQTGLQRLNITATVGVPHDYHVFEQYKEAGFLGVGINIEVWDKKIWQTICPGKDRECGGWDNWVKGMEQAVKVFGHGKVRSSIVAGIEPKQKTLEGIECLASLGVICCASPWTPNLGSALEGHRTPIPAWHLDLARKTVDIYRRYGFDYAIYHQVFPNLTADLAHDILKLEDGVPFEHAQQGKRN